MAPVVVLVVLEHYNGEKLFLYLIPQELIQFLLVVVQQYLLLTLLILEKVLLHILDLHLLKLLRQLVVEVVVIMPNKVALVDLVVDLDKMDHKVVDLLLALAIQLLM